MARVKTEDLPETIKRSSKKAQETYRKALESAHEQYDSEERAHRTALAALKHSFEKVGNKCTPSRRWATSGWPRSRRALRTSGQNAASVPAGRAPAASTSRATPKKSSTSVPRSWAWRVVPR